MYGHVCASELETLTSESEVGGLADDGPPVTFRELVWPMFGVWWPEGARKKKKKKKKKCEAERRWTNGVAAVAVAAAAAAAAAAFKSDPIPHLRPGFSLRSLKCHRVIGREPET
ncbi:hypothetical protein CRUP_014009, partial [Coryphaenoides rupestris]